MQSYTPQHKTDFSVTVYPGDAGWGDEDPARIYFPSKEVKEQYVEEEKKFCATATAEFNGAISKSDREEKRREMLKRRAFFANKQGYAPSMRSRKMWFFRPPMDNKLG